MRLSHFFATSVVAILSFTQPASATYVNQLEQNHVDIANPIVLTQNKVVTEVQPPKKVAKVKVPEEFDFSKID